MTRRSFRPLLAAALLLVLSAAPASAADQATTVAFAKTNYWHGFVEFWGGRFMRTDAIVLLALGVGAVSLFIITRSKWKK